MQAIAVFLLSDNASPVKTASWTTFRTIASPSERQAVPKRAPTILCLRFVRCGLTSSTTIDGRSISSSLCGRTSRTDMAAERSSSSRAR